MMREKPARPKSDWIRKQKAGNCYAMRIQEPAPAMSTNQQKSLSPARFQPKQLASRHNIISSNRRKLHRATIAMKLRPATVLFLLVLPVGSGNALFFKLLCRVRLFRLFDICEDKDNDPVPTPSPIARIPQSPPAPIPAPFPAPFSAPFPAPFSAPFPARTNANATTAPPRTFSLEGFKGISNAYSMEKGIIQIDWDQQYLEEYSGIAFDVFVAPGNYNYTRVLQNTSVSALVSVFKRTSTLQHFRLTGASNITVTSPLLGVNHSLLVTAQVGSTYSNNTHYKTVVTAAKSPLLKGGINIVGIFVPTPRLVIKAEKVARGTEHTVEFIGPVAPQARNLTVGTYITGITSEFETLAKRILAITQNSPDRVVLRVMDAELSEFFTELDLDGSFEVSRTGDGVDRRRRLFLGSVVNWANDNIVQPIGNGITVADNFVKEKVFKPIGDAGSTVADIFDDGQLERAFKFSIVDVDVPWDYKITMPPQPENPLTASLGVKGSAKVDVSLNAKIKLTALAPTYAYVGANANYALGSTLSFSAGAKQKYGRTFNIWKGQRFSRWVWAGPVPIEFFAQPSLDFDVDASVALTAGTTTGFSARGGMSVGVIYDAGSNPVGRTEVVPPFNDFDYTFPTFDGTAAFSAGAGIVLRLSAGLYGGLVNATIGFRCGLDLNAAGGVTVVGKDVIPTVKDFDLSIGLSIPISAKFNYLLGTFEIAPGSPVWQHKWPLITLPTTSIKLKGEHRCRRGANGAAASFSLQADPTYPSALIENKVSGWDEWYFFSPINGNVWSINRLDATVASFEKRGIGSSSAEPSGMVTVALQPKIPPLLKVVKTVSLDSLFPPEPVQCVDALACDGADFFDKLGQLLGTEFNTKIFLYQTPAGPLAPSTVYKFEDLMAALKKLQAAGPTFKLWMGDDCSMAAQKAAFVNMAAFLGQSMRETIIYNACDENNWDLWRADIFKEPTSPPENLAALYAMSSGCGQLGQKYADYRCDDECPQDVNMEITATTNAAWIGAPPPLFCGPKSKYDGLGYWNPQQFCAGTNRACNGQPFFYKGQTAGVHVPVSQDNRFPDFFYTNPLPDKNGFTPNARAASAFPATNVEGCCWWGRGVIQTTGRCNFGKLNKRIGAGAGSNALYPTVNFCTNPQAICTGPPDLKWVAGIFFWVTEVQSYNRNGFNYIDGVKDFVAKGCAKMTVDPNLLPECNRLFEYASGIVNRGCHNPGDGGCPGCVPGATCDPAHNVPERVTASQQVLKALLQYIK